MPKEMKLITAEDIFGLGINLENVQAHEVTGLADYDSELCGFHCLKNYLALLLLKISAKQPGFNAPFISDVLDSPVFFQHFVDELKSVYGLLDQLDRHEDLSISTIQKILLQPEPMLEIINKRLEDKKYLLKKTDVGCQAIAFSKVPEALASNYPEIHCWLSRQVEYHVSENDNYQLMVERILNIIQDATTLYELQQAYLCGSSKTQDCLLYWTNHYSIVSISVKEKQILLTLIDSQAVNSHAELIPFLALLIKDEQQLAAVLAQHCLMMLTSLTEMQNDLGTSQTKQLKPKDYRDIVFQVTTLLNKLNLGLLSDSLKMQLQTASRKVIEQLPPNELTKMPVNCLVNGEQPYEDECMQALTDLAMSKVSTHPIAEWEAIESKKMTEDNILGIN
jgi:hypothetical protein